MDSPPSTSIQSSHTRTSARGDIEQHTGDNYHGAINANQGGVTIVGGRGHNIALLQDNDKVLQSLPGWDLERVRFDESKACLIGTRQKLLDGIRQWVESSGRKRILWISGGAGTGKSSVARSCAAFLDKHGCLGASFFFNRDIPKLNSPDYLITNLCHQLAHFDDRLKQTIQFAIQSMGHIPASSLRSQARKLIVETTTEAKLDKLAVLVIDAVDEAGNFGMREALLNCIAEELPSLPDFVKVIVTSRDESDIRTCLEDCSDEMYMENAEKTEDDIASYIQHRFTTIRKRSHIPKGWPLPEKLEALCLRAGRLFIWASVACNFVDSGRDPTRRLNEILDLTRHQKGSATSPLSKLNSLYTGILQTVFPIQDGRPADYHYVVGSIGVLQTPLTRIELDSLLGLENNSDEDGLVLPDGQVIYLPCAGVIVDSLRSILREDTSGYRRTDGPIRLLHPSLYDFLTIHADDHLRIDVTEQHRMLAIRCLHVLNSQLKFNICDIADASVPNIEISQTSRYISAGLRYSCFSFAHHIANVSDPNTALISALKEFVWEHILHWIEVMSLLRAITKAEQCLQSLTSWIKPSIHKGIEIIVCDTIALLRNCGQGVRLSALHTYYSALALTPKSRELYKCWVGRVPGVPDIDCSHPPWPAVSVRVLEGHCGAVVHVALAPDGKKLASASYDKTLRLWNVESGQPIGDALEGHTDWVNHVVFSPDGKKLASASSDNTLRLWDVESGQPIGDALKGHTSSVKHVVFSPDGKKLASASFDRTLRLWDSESGQPIGGGLKGHTSSVDHVMFSPDGTKLASASFDGTLRLWDVESGQPIGDALKGHTSSVNHVVFSPDGKKLSSASSDNTLHLWDVETGRPIGDAFKGHTGSVNHVVFSPDGKKLASASFDNTLRLWDVESGQPIGDALKGHAGSVNRIVFSPDGKTLTSASSDSTLRLWDVESGQPIGDALKGHTSWVNHVVFSPDGTKLASASFDGTLRLWDVESGQPIGDALKRHTSWVNHVVFSPDGKKLASASSDKTLRLWDVESSQPIGDALKGHPTPVRRVVFSPDGKKLASASFDRTLRLWDSESGQPIGGGLEGHTGWVNHFTFSPDGTKLASASLDKTLRLWDVESGKPIGDALKGHTGSVNHVVLSPDGTKLASASLDNTCLWDVDSGRSIETAEATFPLFARDGHWPPLLSFDSRGYLQHSSKPLLWLPVSLRGRIAVLFPSSVVVGSDTGAVTFIRWPVPLSHVGVQRQPL